MTAVDWKLGLAPALGFPTYDAPLFKESAASHDPVDQIRYIRDQGFRGVDDTFFKKRPREQQDRIGAELARTGMGIGAIVNNTESTRLPLLGSRDKDARAQLHAELLTSIDACKRSGATLLTTIGGRDLGVPRAFQLANAVDNLRFLADTAEKAGVVLCLEHTNPARIPGMLMESAGDAYLLVKAARSRAVKMIGDLLHFHMTESSVIGALETCWDEIATIQASDVPARTELGTGEFNTLAVFRYLRTKGYGGLIGLEHTLAKPGRDSEQAYLSYLRKLNDEI
jgi:hydroxypyruvate isomerase